MKVFNETIEGLPLLKQGKVRDIYDLGEYLLLVATDRLSAFDVVVTNVPGKGKILTQMSNFWFNLSQGIVENHLVATDANKFKNFSHLGALRDPAVIAKLQGRSVLVRKFKTLPVECIVRGYVSGSGWKAYQETGKICGITLPSGLMESDRLPEPIFTPSTKEEGGKHDVNISFEEMIEVMEDSFPGRGEELSTVAKNISLQLYNSGAEHALKRGIIIADTKFEFGINGDNIIVLLDEILTPDSSRFWPLESYTPGGPQNSFDKQYIRDYLLKEAKWNKKPPVPEIPSEVIKNTQHKYLQAQNFLLA